jgi:hypothetical protein
MEKRKIKEQDPIATGKENQRNNLEIGGHKHAAGARDHAGRKLEIEDGARKTRDTRKHGGTI